MKIENNCLYTKRPMGISSFILRNYFVVHWELHLGLQMWKISHRTGKKFTQDHGIMKKPGLDFTFHTIWFGNTWNCKEVLMEVPAILWKRHSIWKQVWSLKADNLYLKINFTIICINDNVWHTVGIQFLFKGRGVWKDDWMKYDQ